MGFGPWTWACRQGGVTVQCPCAFPVSPGGGVGALLEVCAASEAGGSQPCALLRAGSRVQHHGQWRHPCPSRGTSLRPGLCRGWRPELPPGSLGCVHWRVRPSLCSERGRDKGREMPLWTEATGRFPAASARRWVRGLFSAFLRRASWFPGNTDPLSLGGPGGSSGAGGGLR